uniref:V-type proton ATPase subunit G n=1 Tax=Nicotiana tabacum TaxID=4097 RepID=A0A1S4D825_TOBAC|nr:PREDICTED: V-type proton ATPase subunit G 1-like [Nicotiana tabacum]
MASSSGQNGIQLLLAAEQEAQHIVNNARTAKQARLKQAKEEAEKEIAEFRAYMEAEFQRKLEQVTKEQIVLEEDPIGIVMVSTSMFVENHDFDQILSSF